MIRAYRKRIKGKKDRRNDGKNIESIERKIQNFEFDGSSGQMFVAQTQMTQINAPTLAITHLQQKLILQS